MSNENRLEMNLELWAHTHPKEAIWLQYLECEDLEVSPSSDGQWNLKKKQKAFFYSPTPTEEARKWAASLELQDIELLYVYGVGLGTYALPLQGWLESSPQRHIVFLEDDLCVIAKLFETETGTKLLSHPRINLYYFKTVAESEHLFERLFWSFPMSKMAVSALIYYGKSKQKTYQELSSALHYHASIKNSLLEEYLQYGIAFFRNYYTNILHIHEAYLGNALFGKFSHIPAVICGAGPSLDKNIVLLEQLQDRAVIFAGSSALNALSEKGLRPHLGAGIDPNPMQQERLKSVMTLDFPFLYRNRLFPGALNLVKGPKLFLTGAGGYDIADYFEQKLGIEGKTLEEGRNIVNFCLEIAYEMGCNPIIFVGMDLAFTKNREYADGVVSPSLLSSNQWNEEGVLQKDIFGNTVQTQWKWVSEAKWIGDFAKTHPHVNLINATEGGLGFPGVPNTPLAEVASKHLSQEYPISQLIESVYTKHPLNSISKERILSVTQELMESLNHCLQFIRELYEENEIMIKEIKTHQRISYTQTGKAALLETELANEPAFFYVLAIFNDINSRLIHDDVRRLLDPKLNKSAIERELGKLDLTQRNLLFLSNAARVNLEIIKSALLHLDSE